MIHKILLKKRKINSISQPKSFMRRDSQKDSTTYMPQKRINTKNTYSDLNPVVDIPMMHNDSLKPLLERAHRKDHKEIT